MVLTIFDPISTVGSGKNSGKIVYKMFINGLWVESEKNEVFEVRSPADGRTVGYVQKSSIKDAEKAVEAAYHGKKALSGLGAVKRAEILKRTGETLLQNKQEFAGMITQESGKPITVSEGEVQAAAERLLYAAEECKDVYGEEITGDLTPDKTDKIAMIIRQPLGVVLAIAPFNYPLHIAVCKIAPAIAAGNTVICKPASSDPICMIMFTRLLELAGIPKGAFNLITGGGSDIGDFLVNSPKIDMISFTGSTEVGKHIAQICGMKKLHLELGGKAPAIVLKDCDLGLAVSECLKGSLSFSGQRCDSLSRILVENSIAPEFTKKVLAELKNWKTGDPRMRDTKIGPLINENAAKHVEALVKDATKKGAKVLAGGHRKGCFFEPTVLDNVTPKMRIAWEETFGPVFTIMKVADYEEAIRISNESNYGLDACIFTKDFDRTLDAGLRLEDGTVTINACPSHGLGLFPFGGDKDSGIGREGIRHSLMEMTKVHTIVFKKNYTAPTQAGAQQAKPAAVKPKAVPKKKAKSKPAKKKPAKKRKK
jgi:glyceraldehyde-3-phosphate dehydrogenase (NADP+)